MVDLRTYVEKKKEELWHYDFESLSKFPIIKHPLNFLEDEDSIKECESCNYNCCFFGKNPNIDILGRDRNPFLKKTDILDRYQSHEEKENIEFILENGYFIDFFDNARLKLNENWVRVYELDNNIYVEFACPFLSLEGCSDYPFRFNPLCTSFGKNNTCKKQNIDAIYEKIYFEYD